MEKTAPDDSFAITICNRNNSVGILRCWCDEQISVTIFGLAVVCVSSMLSNQPISHMNFMERFMENVVQRFYLRFGTFFAFN